MKRFRMKRKGEKWVSTNRVLLGASKKDPGRNPNFDTEETKLLISLWGEPTVQRTLITTHRKHAVIAKLADQMNEYGYNRSAEEINTRIKNLKCFYNRLKKDLDTGMSNGVTWKHYGAMDEIMTRSIFSVRPNEIPKPSLKYQMEQELEERRQKVGSDSTTQSYENMQELLEENISCSSMSSKEDNGGHLKSDQSVDHIESEDNFLKSKEEPCLNSENTEIEETPVIKDEQIDDTDEVLIDGINPHLENQPEIIYDNSQAACSNSGPFFSNCQNPITTISKSFLKTPQISKVHQSILFTKQPSANANTKPLQGKISLVPTNFLLQQNNEPQPHQIQMRPEPPPKIISYQSNGQANTGIVSSSVNGKMKVLFVNAFQNGKTSRVATTAASKDVLFSRPGIPTNSNIIPQTESENKPADHSKLPKVEDVINNKDTDCAMLFNKLIAMQNENNEIQKERLELERQRLEFEKSMGNKLLEALLSLKSTPTQENSTMSSPRKRSINSEQMPNEKSMSIIPDIISEFNDYHLLTPKTENMD